MSTVFFVIVILVMAYVGLVICGTKEVSGYEMSENVKANINEYYLFEVFSCFGL